MASVLFASWPPVFVEESSPEFPSSDILRSSGLSRISAVLGSVMFTPGQVVTIKELLFMFLVFRD